MYYTYKAWDVVGYVFQADIYCPDCIIGQLPTGEGQAFDGWALAPGADLMSTEDNLAEIAAAFQIDRQNESSFDSGDFPKVIFASDADCEQCGHCHQLLIGG